jgi:NAD(P)H-hydrate epimerase
MHRVGRNRRTSGHHRHRAFEDSDGVDPEWPLWYAAWLQAHLWDRAGQVPTRSQLVHWLLSGERDHSQTDGTTPWPEFYAALILGELSDA